MTPRTSYSESPRRAGVSRTSTASWRYDIPVGTRFPHINGFFSKDILSEDASGWIFARGGAQRHSAAAGPLREPAAGQGIHFILAPGPGGEGGSAALQPALEERDDPAGCEHVRVSSMEAFQAAIRALPLTFKLEPVPSVTWRTLRGRTVVVTYGKAPVVDGAIRN